MAKIINEVVEDQVVETTVTETVQPDGVDVVAPSDEPTSNPSVESDLAPEVKEHADNSKLGFDAREAKRELAKSQKRVEELESGQAERDSYYKNEAAKVGRTDITNQAEYMQAMQRQAEVDSVAKLYETSGLTPEQAAARAQAEIQVRNLSQPVDMKAEIQAVLKAERRNASEISELNTAYGLNLNSIEDLSGEPNYSEILDNLELGMSYYKAYTVANLDSITSGNQEKTRQSAINQAKGFGHIQGNSTNGNIDEYPIPQGKLAEWKLDFPKKTDAQLTIILKDHLRNGRQI